MVHILKRRWDVRNIQVMRLDTGKLSVVHFAVVVFQARDCAEMRKLWRIYWKALKVRGGELRLADLDRAAVAARDAMTLVW